MKKVVGLLIGLFPASVLGECVPVPDCAAIGYTETGCDGNSVKCPFDTSKLKCIPCDSSFRYSCSGDKIQNPIGAACNNKYVSCECIPNAGYYFKNGECVCDTSCDTIGNIYYTDGTCSSCIDSNKTILGLIVKPQKLLVSPSIERKIWTETHVDIEGITNYGTTANYDDYASAITDYSGKSNTLAIVDYYGEDADNIAGVYCYNYGNETGKRYLPALGELNEYIYKNYAVLSSMWTRLGAPVTMEASSTWSSTEGAIIYHSWQFKFTAGRPFVAQKQYGLATICFREI